MMGYTENLLFCKNHSYLKCKGYLADTFMRYMWVRSKALISRKVAGTFPDRFGTAWH